MRHTIIAVVFLLFTGSINMSFAQMDVRYVSVVCNRAEDVVGALRTKNFAEYQRFLKQKNCVEVSVTSEVYGRRVLGFAAQNGNKYCVFKADIIYINGVLLREKFLSAPVEDEELCTNRRV